MTPQRFPESNATLGSHGGHDTIRHDAMPSQHAAQEHQEP